jgi:uncharacterized membrane protein
MEPPSEPGRRPLRSMLIFLPVTLWGFAVVSEVLFRAGWGNDAWHDTAFYAMAAGTIGALVAALPGFLAPATPGDRRPPSGSER